MSVVFRKTHNNYYVISPMGLISPISFVTKNDTEFQRARVIYNVFLAVTVVLMSWHYKEFNDVAHPMKWPSMFGIFVGILIFLYAALAISFSKIDIFQAKKHGAIITKKDNHEAS